MHHRSSLHWIQLKTTSGGVGFPDGTLAFPDGLISQATDCISKAEAQLPFQVKDAARSEAKVGASQNTDRPFTILGQELRLDHRWLDLHTPANNTIMRIPSAI